MGAASSRSGNNVDSGPVMGWVIRVVMGRRPRKVHGLAVTE